MLQTDALIGEPVDTLALAGGLTRGHRLTVCANGRTITSFDRSISRYHKSINHSKQMKRTCTTPPPSILELLSSHTLPHRVSRSHDTQLAPFLPLLSLNKRSPIRLRNANVKCLTSRHLLGLVSSKLSRDCRIRQSKEDQLSASRSI